MTDNKVDQAIRQIELPVEQYLSSLSASEFAEIVNHRIGRCTSEQVEQISKMSRSGFSPRIFDKTFDPLGFGALD